MFKKSLFFIGIVFCNLSLNAENSNSNNTDTVFVNANQTYYIAEEIAKLKECDPYIKKYLTVEDPGIKLFLDYVQRAQLIANIKHKEAEQIKLNFIYASHPSFAKGFVSLNKTIAPKLFALIEDLSKGMKIQMPFIFISFDEKAYNAYAVTYSKNLTSIIIGEALVKDLPDNQFKEIIAHELGHLVNDTEKKVSCFDRFINPSNIFVTSVLSFVSIDIYFSLLFKASTYKFIKNNPVLSSFIGMGLAAPIIWAAILVYTASKKQHTSEDEINADKFAIDITNDPESFIAAMESMKKQHLKDFDAIEQGFSFVDENLERLKEASADWYKTLNENITLAKNNIEDLKKNILDFGADSHPGINSRIEFGKQELEKR